MRGRSGGGGAPLHGKLPALDALLADALVVPGGEEGEEGEDEDDEGMRTSEKLQNVSRRTVLDRCHSTDEHLLMSFRSQN